MSNKYEAIIISVAMILSIFLWDYLRLILNGWQYTNIYSAYSIVYVAGYLWGFFTIKKMPSYKYLVICYITIKFYIIIYQLYIGDINSLGKGGDAESFHIPQAFLVNGDYIGHLLGNTGHFNGRLTQVLLSLYIEIIANFTINIDYEKINIVAFIANTLIGLVTIYYYRKIIIIKTNEESLASKGIWFLIFNPYFLTVTSMPQKEALLFLGLALFTYSMVVEKARIRWLVISLIIISLERIYMTPLLIVIWTSFESKFNLRWLLYFTLGYIFIELYIGLEVAMFMLANNSESMEDGESYLGGFNILTNIIRAYFGPFALRNLLDEELSFNVLESSHYLLIFFYPYIAIRASVKRLNFGIPIILVLMFVALLIPYHSSFKFLMIVFFGGLFLTMNDRMSERISVNKFIKTS